MAKKRFKRKIKRIKNDLIYITVIPFIRFMQIITRRQAFAVAHGISIMAFYLAAGERRKTIRHLTIAYGREKTPEEIRLMARTVFFDLGRNLVDAIRLPQLLDGQLNSLVQVHGRRYLNRALAKGKGVIIISGHIGNWELLASWLVNNGYPLWAVGAKLYDQRINAIITSQRDAIGYHNIERGKATRQMFRALKQGDIVGMLMDQDTRVDGVFVDFFGKKAFTPVGPVKMAMKLGCALVPLAIHIEPDNTHVFEIKPEIELIKTDDIQTDRLVNTEKCSHVIEGFIREQPTQWVWMHRRWKTKQKKAGLS